MHYFLPKTADDKCLTSCWSTVNRRVPFLFSFFRTIEEEARTALQWSEEMLDDFGVKELTWTKEKAQLDLENLNKAYKTLDEFDTSGMQILIK